MANRKFRIKQRNAVAGYDVLYPETIGEQVLLANGTKTAEQLNTDVTTHMNDYVRQPGSGVTTGSANTYALTLTPALTAYTAFVGVTVQINAANTGASTINVNGLGAKSIRDSKGVALTAGKLVLNGVYTLRYDGTNFILQGEGGSGNALASDLLSGKTASVDAGDITGTMPNNGARTTPSGIVGVPLTNLVTNGSFESGLTGWAIGGNNTQSSTQKKYGTFSMKQNIAVAGQDFPQVNVIGAFNGRKIYACAWGYIESSNSTVFAFNLHAFDGTTGVDSGWLSFTTVGGWQFKSGLINCDRNGVKVVLAQISTTGTGVCYYDGITLIDLTACFGAGNEPTQAQMDAIMTMLGGYFEGTVILGDVKIANGAYVTNGVLGTPEIFVADAGLTRDSLLATKSAFGITGTMPNRAGDTTAASYHASGTSIHVVPATGYVDGVDDATVITDANFVEANIKSGVSIFGQTGTLVPLSNEKKWASGTSSVSSDTITVTGLLFRPRIIFAQADGVSQQHYMNTDISLTASFLQQNASSPSGSSVSTNGFVMRLVAGYFTAQMTWNAIE